MRAARLPVQAWQRSHCLKREGVGRLVSEGRKGRLHGSTADPPPGCAHTHPQSPVPVPGHILHFGACNVTQTTGERGRETRADGQSVRPHTSSSGLLRPSPHQTPTSPEPRSPAHWDGEIEHAEHAAPLVCHEEVGDEGRRDGGVTGFPNPHQAPGQEEQPESLGNETWGSGTPPCSRPPSLPPQPALERRGTDGGRGLNLTDLSLNPGSTTS